MEIEFIISKQSDILSAYNLLNEDMHKHSIFIWSWWLLGINKYGF